MKLIADIIEELIDSEKSLTGPFLKTKVLAAKVKNAELLSWINLELNGYTDGQTVPDYRKSGCRLVGSWVNGTALGGYWKGAQMDLPQTGYKGDWDTYFSTVIFRESIAGLEAFTINTEGVELSEPLSSDLTEMVAAKMRSFGNPYFSLVNASKKISVNRIRDILAIIRSRLLDFMLKIDEEYGFVMDINKLSEQKNIREKISTIMSQTIIHNTGDGNVVNTGNHSALNITTSIQKNDFAALSKLFADNGMDEKDIAELQSVINTEKPDFENKTFGQKVNIWIKKMLGKSLDTSWKIGIGAAGKLLAEGIQHYYGMK